MLIGDLVINPSNSLVCQSRNAEYHPLVEDPTGKRNIRVNGDGFGVAWYGEEASKGSCCFKFVTPGNNKLVAIPHHRAYYFNILNFSLMPAWSNRNLKNLCEHVYSHTVFAHVRAVLFLVTVLFLCVNTLFIFPVNRPHEQYCFQWYHR